MNKTLRYLAGMAALLAICSCTQTQQTAPANMPALTIAPDYRPASHVSRTQAVANAAAYVRLKWRAESRHIMHGKGPDGVQVDTPDSGYARRTAVRPFAMWWKVGENTGMPYMWGGFDTPDEFLAKLQKPGIYAGDYASLAKVAAGDAAVSKYAAGIDCSGLVSRAWRLRRPYSTRELAGLCRKVGWNDLQPGDILLKPGEHVMLFSHWNLGHVGSQMLVIEAAGCPRWACNMTCYPISYLQKKGYQPYRYRKIR